MAGIVPGRGWAIGSLDRAYPGCSIVVELAGLYGGALTLGTAPIGGLRAELVLPGA